MNNFFILLAVILVGIWLASWAIYASIGMYNIILCNEAGGTYIYNNCNLN